MRNILLWVAGLFLLFVINGVIPKTWREWHWCMLGIVLWWLAWGGAMFLRGLYRYMVK